jgi:hypothetical protein
VDAVVHLAGRTHALKETAADPLILFRRVNVTGMERLARMAAVRGVRRFIYLSSVKANGDTGMAGAAMSSHIPNRGEQMVRYYGYHSNVSRGKRQKEGSEEALPCILEPQGDEKTFRRNWARLIQKIYEVDSLICPK